MTKTQWKRNAWLLPALMLSFVACKKDDTPSSDTRPRPEAAKKDLCKSCMEGIGGTPVVLENNGKKVTVTERNGIYYLQGDIMLSKEQVAHLKGETKPDARTGVSSFARMWPNRTVFYTVNPNMPWSSQQDIIDAINVWEDSTNLTFVVRTTEPNFIEFMPAVDECSSYIGMVGGRQVINISPGCFTWGAIHEIGHALGFFHEHSRKDRYLFITVHEQNIWPGFAHNFLTYDQMGIPGFRLGQLDWASIMLYDSYAFSIGSQPTMTKLDGSTFTSSITLSAGDVATYNHMYNRPYFVITQENMVYVHNSQETGSRWDCRFRAYTDASMTTLANLQWPFECWISYTWEDESAPGGTRAPTRRLLQPGVADFIIGEGYSLTDRNTGLSTMMDYHVYNNGFGD